MGAFLLVVICLAPVVRVGASSVWGVLLGAGLTDTILQNI